MAARGRELAGGALAHGATGTARAAVRGAASGGGRLERWLIAALPARQRDQEGGQRQQMYDGTPLADALHQHDLAEDEVDDEGQPGDRQPQRRDAQARVLRLIARRPAQPHERQRAQRQEP